MSKEEKLYRFTKLESYLEALGVKIGADSDFELVKVDFDRAVEQGNVEFVDGKILIEVDGVKFPGYVYKRKYYVDRYGLPRMHLTVCETIRDFMSQGRYFQSYWWAAEPTVPVIDAETGRVLEKQKLRLCGYCRNELAGDAPENSRQFYEWYQEAIESAKRNWRDLNGYSGGFWHLSRAIRQEVGRCEHCGLEIKKDYQHFHIHHKDGNKDNNARSNLQCLCLLCHYGVDTHHRKRLLEDDSKKRRMRRFLWSRLEDLKACKNPYLKEKPIQELLRAL